jgi:hypothetical protein
VVHLDEVRHLVCGDIVEHRQGRKNQPPATLNISVSRTDTPPALCIAYANPLYFASNLCSKAQHSRDAPVPRRNDEVVADPDEPPHAAERGMASMSMTSLHGTSHHWPIFRRHFQILQPTKAPRLPDLATCRSAADAFSGHS